MDLSTGGRQQSGATASPAPASPAAMSPSQSSVTSTCTFQPPADCGGHGTLNGCSCTCDTGYATDFTNLAAIDWCVSTSEGSQNSTTGSRDTDLSAAGGVVYNGTSTDSGQGSSSGLSKMGIISCLLLASLLIIIGIVWWYRRKRLREGKDAGCCCTCLCGCVDLITCCCGWMCGKRHDSHSADAPNRHSSKHKLGNSQRPRLHRSSNGSWESVGVHRASQTRLGPHAYTDNGSHVPNRHHASSLENWHDALHTQQLFGQPAAVHGGLHTPAMMPAAMFPQSHAVGHSMSPHIACTQGVISPQLQMQGLVGLQPAQASSLCAVQSPFATMTASQALSLGQQNCWPSLPSPQLGLQGVGSPQTVVYSNPLASGGRWQDG